jgi:hypothetical protein
LVLFHRRNPALSQWGGHDRHHDREASSDVWTKAAARAGEAAVIVESALIVGGLTWMFETVRDHAVGATGHEFIREFVRGAVRELGDPQKRERNHDIVRAVRGAQLDALEAVIDGYCIANRPRWDRAPDPATERFLEDATVFCRRARRRLNDKEAEPEFAPSATLTASIEGLLADQPVLAAAGARAAALGSFAEDAVLDELADALKPLPVPDDFAAYLRTGAGKGHPRFLDLFGAGIAARLKDKEDTRFRDILQIGWLADLKGLGFERRSAGALDRTSSASSKLASRSNEVERVAWLTPSIIRS